MAARCRPAALGYSISPSRLVWSQPRGSASPTCTHPFAVRLWTRRVSPRGTTRMTFARPSGPVRRFAGSRTVTRGKRSAEAGAGRWAGAGIANAPAVLAAAGPEVGASGGGCTGGGAVATGGGATGGGSGRDATELGAGVGAGAAATGGGDAAGGGTVVWGAAGPCCMDQRAGAVSLPSPRFRRCGRTPGVPAPACGSARRRRWPPRSPAARRSASAACRRSPVYSG